MYSVINKLLKYFKSPVRAFNDSGERIESMRFSVPALRVGVLEYGAGQLQTGNAALEGKAVRLYYPPEAVSDEKFLKSLETAPVVVGGHDSTTNEQNKKIDGWAHSVHFDAGVNAAMIAGVVKGAKEVAYIKGNLGASGFGASAFVDIYNLRVENGVTPDGQEYDAVAGELRATHVALAPHVRDPENKIKVINAVCVNSEGEMMEAENANGDFITSRVYRVYRYSIYKHPSFGFVAIDDEHKKPIAAGSTEKIVDDNAKRSIDLYLGDKAKNSLEAENAADLKKYTVVDNHVKTRTATVYAKDKNEAMDKGASELKTTNISVYEAKNSRGEIINNKEYSMDPKELAALVKNAVDEAIAEKNSEDRMGAMEETLKAHGDALNEINEKLNPKAEGENADDAKPFEGKETPEEEKKEAATLENAKPSQEMIKAFATAMNVDFGAKTPSFMTLAALAGISETDPASRIAAVNAKFGEIVQNAPKENQTAAAHNTVGEVF
jgi:hypothetical protein